MNSEIFARCLFSRNFAYPKFRKNKPSQDGEITLPFTDAGLSCPSREFLTWKIRLLTLFARIEFPRKLPDLQ